MSRRLKFRWLRIAVMFSNVIGFNLFSAPAGAAGDTILRRLRIFGQQDKLRADRSKGRETWA